MKIIVTMKTPDVLHEAVTQATGLDDDAYRKVMNGCAKWFRFEEYVRLEIDTVADTCTVLPCR